MIVRARAPLRLGLAGGGTDVAPYCDQFGGYVLNATIDRYAYAVLTPLSDDVVNFVATDQQIDESFSLQDVGVAEPELKLHRAVYLTIINQFNGGEHIPIRLSTFCDAPLGSGLGSSSTLVVVMVRAFVELLNLPLGDHDIAKIAYQIERVDCGLKGGKQDQYSATFGGFNFMEFYDLDRAVINPLRVKNWIICELEASLVLFYTGRSRESAKIIADQSDNVQRGSSEALDAMHSMKKEALVMKEALLRGDFEAIIDSMGLGWSSKKRSATTVSNELIDSIYDGAILSGARAGKVSGAGGGGFMMFFVPPEQRMEVVRSLSQFDGHVSNCHFTKNGCQAWRC